MAKEWANAFYDSLAWKKCRKEYAKSVGGLCERCLKKGVITPGRIVHHKTYLTQANINDPAVTLNFANLMYVCKDCHEEIHRGEKRYTIDALGRVETKDS